jgi:Cu(I)/Ag(I) efflux system periplasmic protein CusF
MKRFTAVALLAATLGLALTASAQTALPATAAEVRKVDLDAKKITLKHETIQNLDMPPMTMVFQVKDPALLTGVKAGDKVNVTVDKVNGSYTVLSLVAAVPK